MLPAAFSKLCRKNSAWVGVFDIKLGQFMQDELNVVQTKIKNREAAGLDEIPPEVWKTKKFNDLLL